MRRLVRDWGRAPLFDDLGSTSWHHRNHVEFARLDGLLIESGLQEPCIVIVGPGAVTRAAAPLLNDSARPAMFFRKWIGDAARYADQALRRVPLIPVKSLEALEVDKALSMPHRLVVVDRSARLLEAVRRDLPTAVCRVVDITLTPVAERADVVIAMNVISRLGPAAAVGMRNVLAALKDGGLLVIDDRSAREHLANMPRVTRVGGKIHRVIPEDAAGGHTSVDAAR